MVHSSAANNASHRRCADFANDRVRDFGRERRRPASLELRGFGVLEDGTKFALLIVEVGCTGCRIETQTALFLGAELKMGVLGGRAAVAARVQWQEDGCAELAFLDRKDATRPYVPRAHERLRLDAAVTLRQPGRRHYRALLLDLTPAGCKVQFVERPTQGERLWVRFDGLDTIEAIVIWADGWRGGLKFARPI